VPINKDAWLTGYLMQAPTEREFGKRNKKEVKVFLGRDDSRYDGAEAEGV